MVTTPNTTLRQLGGDGLVSSCLLDDVIAIIDKVFGVDDILSETIDKGETEEYYTKSAVAYHLVHSRKGAVHMALTEHGERRNEDLGAQAGYVGDRLTHYHAERVLELGSGKGYNSLLLAQRYPDVQFVGIDLTRKHVAHAKRAARRFRNLEFTRDDFERINLASGNFDLVFAVESLCHSISINNTLSEAFRMLRSGGGFVVFDGFRLRPLEDMSSSLRTACMLVEKSMSLAFGRTLDEFSVELAKARFTTPAVSDLSSQVLPNMRRFQSAAVKFFSSPILRTAATAILPRKLLQNAIAGLLMPVTVTSGVHGYFLVESSRDTGERR